jgi:hypothetical protein
MQFGTMAMEGGIVFVYLTPTPSPSVVPSEVRDEMLETRRLTCTALYVAL